MPSPGEIPGKKTELERDLSQISETSSPRGKEIHPTEGSGSLSQEKEEIGSDSRNLVQKCKYEKMLARYMYYVWSSESELLKVK